VQKIEFTKFQLTFIQNVLNARKFLTLYTYLKKIFCLRIQHETKKFAPKFLYFYSPKVSIDVI
jgi:hypothetical protein